jgi:hypothetical protein
MGNWTEGVLKQQVLGAVDPNHIDHWQQQQHQPSTVSAAAPPFVPAHQHQHQHQPYQQTQYVPMPAAYAGADPTAAALGMMAGVVYQPQPEYYTHAPTAALTHLTHAPHHNLPIMATQSSVMMPVAASSHVHQLPHQVRLLDAISSASVRNQIFICF